MNVMCNTQTDMHVIYMSDRSACNVYDFKGYLQQQQKKNNIRDDIK